MTSFDKESFNGIKLLYCTDTHNRFNNPIYRKGDFKADVTAKYIDIYNICNQHKVDGLLHGGDMYDTPNVQESTWVHFSQLLMKMGVPIYAIPGNHDMEGHNPITLPTTPIYYMSQLGVINLIERNNMNEPILIRKNGISVQITGRGYHPSIDEDGTKEDDYVLKEKKADYAIHMVHGNLLDKPIHQLATFTLVEEIKHTLADLTLGAHYHKGFPLTKIGENDSAKYFYNPGATVRKSRDEMKRMPKVALIYIGEKGIHIEDIYLPSAKQPQEVIDIEKIEKKQHNEEELNNLIEDFKGRASVTQTISVQDMLMSMGSQKNISEPVKNTAMNFILQAKSKLGGAKK